MLINNQKKYVVRVIIINNSSIYISIITPLYNSKLNNIEHLLQSLYQLDYSAKEYQIIMVDDGSKEYHIREVHRWDKY